MYLWWKCNKKCNFCIEYENMEKMWNEEISKKEILQKLIHYKRNWFSHVTFLWWEPFIQKNFLFALKIAKKIGYKILVTTNCTLLHIENIASSLLPYIDELILSMAALDYDLQKKISRSNNYVLRDDVLYNIWKYWKGERLKVNIVVTVNNLTRLFNLTEYLLIRNIEEISITYPDINYWYYWREYILNEIAPSYSECIEQILPIINLCEKKWIKLKLPDFPFCVFPLENINKFIKLTDDYDFATRTKIDHNNTELDRWDLSDFRLLPRKRRKTYKCIKCNYNNLCWGPSYVYKLLYWLDEINPIN